MFSDVTQSKLTTVCSQLISIKLVFLCFSAEHNFAIVCMYVVCTTISSVESVAVLVLASSDTVLLVISELCNSFLNLTLKWSARIKYVLRCKEIRLLFKFSIKHSFLNYHPPPSDFALNFLVRQAWPLSKQFQQVI